MGESTKRLRSGGALKGMRRCNSAMRGETTSTSMRWPLCCTRKANGFLGVPRSTCAVKGAPFTVPVIAISFKRDWLRMS